MNEVKIRSNGEYAVKYKSPIYENKDDVEIFDIHSWKMLDIKSMTVDQICDITSEVWWTWRNISEDEYNSIINKKEE